MSRGLAEDWGDWWPPTLDFWKGEARDTTDITRPDKHTLTLSLSLASVFLLFPLHTDVHTRKKKPIHKYSRKWTGG